MPSDVCASLGLDSATATEKFDRIGVRRLVDSWQIEKRQQRTWHNEPSSRSTMGSAGLPFDEIYSQLQRQQQCVDRGGNLREENEKQECISPWPLWLYEVIQLSGNKVTPSYKSVHKWKERNQITMKSLLNRATTFNLGCGKLYTCQWIYYRNSTRSDRCVSFQTKFLQRCRTNGDLVTRKETGNSFLHMGVWDHRTTWCKIRKRKLPCSIF